MSAQEVLQRYIDEDLPDFTGLKLTDVNQRGHYGDTPINTACVRGIIPEVEALLSADADPNALGERGNTPLHNAAGQGHAAVVRMLLNAGADKSRQNVDGYTARDVAVLMKKNDVIAELDSGGLQ